MNNDKLEQLKKILEDAEKMVNDLQVLLLDLEEAEEIVNDLEVLLLDAEIREKQLNEEISELNELLRECVAQGGYLRMNHPQPHYPPPE